MVTVGFPLLALNAICRRSLVIHHILPVINNTKLKSLSIETKNPGNCQPVASFTGVVTKKQRNKAIVLRIKICVNFTKLTPKSLLLYVT